MAQVKKEEVRQRILEAANEAFQEKGFHKTSMRYIAHLSGRSLANVYNYFASKEDLLGALTADVRAEISGFFTAFTAGNVDWSAMQFNDEGAREEMVEGVVSFLAQNRSSLALLVHNAPGTKYQGFIDDVVEGYVSLEQAGAAHLREMGMRLKTEPSEYILRAICRFNVQLLMDFIKDGLTREEMRAYALELVQFYREGHIHYVEPIET